MKFMMGTLRPLFILCTFVGLCCTLAAQPCDWQKPAAPEASLLTWLTGHAPSIPAADLQAASQSSDPVARAFALLRLGKVDEAKQALPLGNPARQDTIDGQDSASTEANNGDQQRIRAARGVLELIAGTPEAAAAALGSYKAHDDSCGTQVLALAAQYLQRYGGSVPLFPGFNGGFYHMLKDSLNGGNKLKLAQFDQAIAVLAGCFQLSGGKSPWALELLGDLLYRHPDRFIGNYLGALVYMRAGYLSEGLARDVMFEKGLYAMEAPQENWNRFDRYLYKQLQKAMEEDIAATELAPAETEGGRVEVRAGGLLYLGEKDGGRLAPILRKAWQKSVAEALENTQAQGQVDPRAVKKDTTFNLYAILLIGTVIGAIVFFWWRLRKAARA